MGFINTVVGIPLGYLMWLCYIFLKNYGFAIIIFTLLTKVILLPVNIWVQKNSIKMIKLQPAVNEIAAKHAGNRDKAAEEQLLLYKKENYKPLAGIIPMLIQIPIILGLISVIYNPLQHLLHLDPDVISAFVSKAQELSPGVELGSTAQMKVIEFIRNPATADLFSSIQSPGIDAVDAVSRILGMDLQFMRLDLSRFPSISSLDFYMLIPILSGLSAFLLCFFQNRENVLQKEQGFWGQWGMAIFLTAFSTYFAFVVPIGVGIYWIFGNVFAILMLYLLNWMYDPRKYIDYEALEKSKINLAQSKAATKKLKPTKEQKLRAKEDYKRFCKDENVKQLVYYSEKSGFYKYFADQISKILEKSDISIHYITSDPNDAIFEKKEPRIIPYYIDEFRLIPLFMKVDSDVIVMTTPNLQTYHLKRSLVRKDIEYIYTPHDPLSTHMGAATGAFDHFDTILCVGEHQIHEIRETEKVYGLPEKNLIPCGYSFIDNLLIAYSNTEKKANVIKKILIAPSWQEGNILESCVDPLLDNLLGKNYDITLRPHPEFVKRYSGAMQSIIDRYSDRFDEHFRIETDFSSNVTIFTADLVITDWSGIAFEFSYATKKPSLFIDTPMKVMNPEYNKIDCVPIELSLRNEIGCSLSLDNLDNISDTVALLLQSDEVYREKINSVIDRYLFNAGHSAEVAADYIISAVNRYKKKEQPEILYGQISR